MKYCKHCGHSSMDVYDEWGFAICPHCGGEDLINLEEEECIDMQNQENKKQITNSIACIVDNLPTMNNGTDALGVMHQHNRRDGNAIR